MIYCVATYCPISSSCARLKAQTQTDKLSYGNFSDHLIATLKGWRCNKFAEKGSTSTTGTTT